MKKPLDKIKQILEKNSFVVFGYLFGSRATSIYNAKSDWDIAVYFDSKKIKDWSRFQLEAEIERAIKDNVQITVLNVIEEPVFAFEVINQSIVIVDKKTEERTLFEASVLRSYHDWNYFLKRHMAFQQTETSL